MPVTDITRNSDQRSLTITAEFAAPVERVWQVYADPRQLERVWGPPGYPATVVDHDLRPGGRMTYYMTSPEGEKYYGRWDVEQVDHPTSFSFIDAFADENFAANTEMAMGRGTFSFEATDGGTRATYVTTYDTAEALQQVLEMGMEEGARAATNQIDDLLAAG